MYIIRRKTGLYYEHTADTPRPTVMWTEHKDKAKQFDTIDDAKWVIFHLPIEISIRYNCAVIKHSMD
jgi:hypothetical protein